MLQNVFSHRLPLYNLFDEAEFRALHTPCYPPGSAVTLTFYRPQRSCGQGNIFTPVCHSVHKGVCLSACWNATTPYQGDPPAKETPLEGGTPLCQGEPPAKERPPWKEAPPAKETPRRRPSQKQTPPGSIPLPGIRSMSGQYASYWNALLFLMRSVKSLIRISVQSMLSGPFCFNEFVAIISMSALSLKTIKTV